MIKSLAVKGGMLVAAILLVLWIGRPAPHTSTLMGDGQTVEDEHREAVVPHEERAAVATLAKAPVPATGAASTGAQVRHSQEKLDLNRATAEELQALPGLGLVLAQRVVEQRTKHGPFLTVDDLRDVKGIGKKRMDQLRPLVKVERVAARGPKQGATQKAKAL